MTVTATARVVQPSAHSAQELAGRAEEPALAAHRSELLALAESLRTGTDLAGVMRRLDYDVGAADCELPSVIRMFCKRPGIVQPCSRAKSSSPSRCRRSRGASRLFKVTLLSH